MALPLSTWFYRTARGFTSGFTFCITIDHFSVCLFVRPPLHSRLDACPRALPVDVYRNMSRRAVYFTSAQLRAITADKLRCGYFLLAVLSVLLASLTFSAPDPAVDLQRDVLRARTVSVSVTVAGAHSGLSSPR